MLFFSFVIFSSCSVTEHDCICSQEYRSITAVVVDENRTPLEGLAAEVRNKEGKLFDFEGEYTPFPGTYIVMTDSYTREFSIIPGEIFFTARGKNKEGHAVYLINTDKCRCHINKVSGLDTLVLK